MPPPPVTQLVILAHPDAASFCGTIARRWRDRARGHSQICDIRDLYRDGFDPLLQSTEQPGKAGYTPNPENLAECRNLQQLGVLVFVYPVWFGSPPAILKGYIERVVGSGLAFGKEGHDNGPLTDVRLVHISTSASGEPWLAEKGIPIALHTIFERYFAQVFGAKKTYSLHLDSITECMSKEQAAFNLSKIDQLADRICAEANTDRWDRAREASTRASATRNASRS